MNPSISIIKNLIQINIVTAMLSVLVFVAIREQQATTTDSKQKFLEEPHAYHSAVKENPSDEQPIENSDRKLEQYEQRLKKVEGLLQSKNAQSSTLKGDRSTATTNSQANTLPKTAPVSEIPQKTSPPSRTELLTRSLNLKTNVPQSLNQTGGKWFYSIEPNSDIYNEGNRISQNPSAQNHRPSPTISPGTFEIAVALPQEQPSENPQPFIKSGKLTFDYWSALLLQPILGTDDKSSKLTLTVQEAEVSEELLAVNHQETLELALGEAELPITPTIPYGKGNPRIEKDTSIRYANDIAYGLVVAGENGQINHGTRTYRKVQTAINLLRRGEDIDDAARRAEIPADVLKQLIKWGEVRPGSVAVVPQARELEKNPR